jgi:hypothetical protein
MGDSTNKVQSIDFKAAQQLQKFCNFAILFCLLVCVDSSISFFFLCVLTFVHHNTCAVHNSAAVLIVSVRLSSKLKSDVDLTINAIAIAFLIQSIIDTILHSKQSYINQPSNILVAKKQRHQTAHSRSSNFTPNHFFHRITKRKLHLIINQFNKSIKHSCNKSIDQHRTIQFNRRPEFQLNCIITRNE